MSEQPIITDATAVSAQPIIVAADVAAGHDGAAEVVVAVRYPNGAQRALSLPYDAVAGALDAAGVTSLAQLIGKPWTALVATSSPPPSPTSAAPASQQPAFQPS